MSHWFFPNIIWKSMSIKGSSAKYKAHKCTSCSIPATVGGDSHFHLSLVHLLYVLPRYLLPLFSPPSSNGGGWWGGAARMDPDRRGEERWRWVGGRGGTGERPYGLFCTGCDISWQCIIRQRAKKCISTSCFCGITYSWKPSISDFWLRDLLIVPCFTKTILLYFTV